MPLCGIPTWTDPSPNILPGGHVPHATWLQAIIEYLLYCNMLLPAMSTWSDLHNLTDTHTHTYIYTYIFIFIYIYIHIYCICRVCIFCWNVQSSGWPMNSCWFRVEPAWRNTRSKLQEPFCQTFLGGSDPSGDAAGFCAMVWHKGSFVQTYQLPISLKDLLTVSIYIYRNIYIYIFIYL